MRAGKRETEVANSILNVTCECPCPERRRKGWVILMSSVKVSETAATLYGKEHEGEALDKLGEVLGLTILEAKKVVPPAQSWLVCIPDGLLEEDDSIVEVKCPYKCRDNTFQALAETDQNFCLQVVEGGGLELDQDHDYYYQVQGMLNMMDRQNCYFAVWSPTQFHYQVIHQDKQFWENIILPKLLEFYR